DSAAGAGAGGAAGAEGAAVSTGLVRLPLGRLPGWAGAVAPSPVTDLRNANSSILPGGASPGFPEGNQRVLPAESSFGFAADGLGCGLGGPGGVGGTSLRL